MKNCAFLSNHNGFTVFQTENSILRFKAPYSLIQYTEVKEWDNGYLVVMAKYAHNDKEEEEYIDLIPILTDLYQDPKQILSQIEKVEILNNDQN